MLELFRIEAESQTQVLTAGLLALERAPGAAEQLEACMRAAHSLKGAARIVGLDAAVGVAHAMEDCFAGAQRGDVLLRQRHTDVLLRGVDLLGRIARTHETQLDQWVLAKKPELDAFRSELARVLQEKNGEAVTALEAVASESESAPNEPKDADRVLRVSADNLDRLLGLAGESRVESRWLTPFAQALLRLKRLQFETGRSLDALREALPVQSIGEKAQSALADAQRQVLECRQQLAQRLAELEMFDRRSINLSQRLYDEALSCRMRPFADGVQGLPRLARDLARALGKQARLEIVGDTTEVDRDILQKLEAPLTHLLRNALDHGIEAPEERHAAGKPAEGVVRLEARHSGGLLQIQLSDDGRGIALERVREAVLRRQLTNAETAARMTEAELYEFLFLPGFTLKDTVTEISGRGVGLDVVQNMVRQVRGSVRVHSQPGQGARFQLQLPLTLSVMRTLLAEIGGEPYAFPLASIVRTLKLAPQEIQLLEGRQHVNLDGRAIGLVVAQQLLGDGEPRGSNLLSVIVLGDPHHAYGLVVDRFLGERELVVHPLDPRLGKIKDVAAGALMEDGTPVLIVDVEDLLRSVDKLVSGGQLSRVRGDDAAAETQKRKRILVVDDSFTVRELQRKLLGTHGYDVDIAVDGMDGWNAVRTGHFDLLVTDIDMPRMDGVELVTLLRKDPNLKALPVMIVSYKDREDDRRRGLDAGADYYLTKGSFHDETLLQAVVDLIGEASA